ncbi:hypothetical protein DFQ28_000244 [Apophysomyces sp. BC1034]|nr:hypothetical protein DFQ28_000244 [Apophysomyces sp. BC1034]
MSELLNKVYNYREELKVEAQEFARLKGSFRNNWDLTLKTRKIRRDTLRTRCPFVIKSVNINDNWTLTGAVDEHNHDLATTPIVFHQHYNETFRGLDGQLTILPKDVDNMRTRLFPQRDDQFEKMGEIAEYLHQREYEI